MNKEDFEQFKDINYLKEFLQTDADIANKLDKIDYYCRENTYIYPFCNYNGKLPPIDCRDLNCTKYHVEQTASLYRIRPDLYIYDIYDKSRDEYIIKNIRLDGSDMKSKNCVRIEEHITECTNPDYNGRKYYYGDMILDKRYGEICYNYYKHLIDNNFQYEIESSKIRKQFEEQTNRKYYMDLVINKYWK